MTPARLSAEERNDEGWRGEEARVLLLLHLVGS